jgi:hypothetical protein
MMLFADVWFNYPIKAVIIGLLIAANSNFLASPRRSMP